MLRCLGIRFVYFWGIEGIGRARCSRVHAGRPLVEHHVQWTQDQILAVSCGQGLVGEADGVWWSKEER